MEDKQEKINKMQTELNINTQKLIDVISLQVDDLAKQIKELKNAN